MKCNFLFENLIFDNPKFCKNTILTHGDTIYVSKNVKKSTIKLGKTAKKNLDQFLTYNLNQFLTYKRPNLGPAFNSTAYIYIYIYTVATDIKVKLTPREYFVAFAFAMILIGQMILRIQVHIETSPRI